MKIRWCNTQCFQYFTRQIILLKHLISIFTIRIGNNKHSLMAINTSLSRISDTVLFFIALLTAVTNSFLIMVILRSRTLRTVTNTLIVSMSVSDLVLAPALIVYISIRFSDHDGYLTVAYSFSIIILAMSQMMALVSFFLVSLERYVAVCYPILYTKKVTMKKTKIVICIIWFLNAVFIGMSLMYYILQQPIEVVRHRISPRRFVPRKMYFWSYALNASVFFLLTMVLNIRLFSVFRSNTRKVSVMRGARTRLVKSGESMRILKTLMTSLCVNVLTFLPSFICGYFESTSTVLVVDTFAFWAMTSNSFLTPVIHICMNRSYRLEFFVFFGCVKNNRVSNASLEIPGISRRRRDAIVMENISVIGRWVIGYRWSSMGSILSVIKNLTDLKRLWS